MRQLWAGVVAAALATAGLAAQDDALTAKDDPGRAVPLAQLLSKSGRATVEGISTPPAKIEGGSEDVEDYQAAQQKFAFQSFGCHFIEYCEPDIRDETLHFGLPGTEARCA